MKTLVNENELIKLARKNTFRFYNGRDERKKTITCPLCNGTIRYTKNSANWNLRCQDCNWCGDVITLLMYDNKFNYKQCLDYVSEKLDVEIDRKSKELINHTSKKPDASHAKNTIAITQQRKESNSILPTNSEKIQTNSEQKIIEACKAGDDDADFNLFWSEYPRKVSKADARKSFEKRRKMFQSKRSFLRCAFKRNHGI